jgi:hypothetical protein
VGLLRRTVSPAKLCEKLARTSLVWMQQKISQQGLDGGGDSNFVSRLGVMDVDVAQKIDF